MCSMLKWWCTVQRCLQCYWIHQNLFLKSDIKEMGCDLLRLLYCQERWRSISVAHFFAVIHSRLQQILCELWIVNAVDVRLRVLLHLSIVHLIADPTVNQRSVISESTFSRVWIFSSFRASGGFQVKAMKRITHTKSTLQQTRF